MKRIVSGKQVASLWASQAQSEAFNQGRTLFFRDSGIYSYGRHFPIARHMKAPNGHVFVAFTTQGYSVTTAKHMSWVRNTLKGVSIVPCHNPDTFEPVSAAQDLEASAMEHEDKAKRARTQWAKEYNTAEALRLQGLAADVREWYSVRA